MLLPLRLKAPAVLLKEMPLAFSPAMSFVLLRPTEPLNTTGLPFAGACPLDQLLVLLQTNVGLPPPFQIAVGTLMVTFTDPPVVANA